MARPGFHFSGIGGSGMSALAQMEVLAGRPASGSDRAFDRGERPEARAYLEKLGVRIFAQDGSALADPPEAVVQSSAVEDTVPEIALARERGIPLVHRSELLARHVAAHRSIAVAGTSGKSTVVAMIFEILRAAGRDPSLITGGEVRALRDQGYWGNAWVGRSDLLVVEADESDGSLVRYTPAVGVLLNVQRDHHEPATALQMFRSFVARTRERVVVSDDPSLAEFRARALVFGRGPDAAVRPTSVDLGAERSRLTIDGVTIDLPVPGAHNAWNAIAAIAAVNAVGVSAAEAAAGLRSFSGVHRRFEVVGSGGVTVVDDFAHNPDKVRAALATAALRAPRTIAVFQPHGFGPTRFMRADLVRAFGEALRADDRLLLLPIFYAGGTASADISSDDLAADIVAHGRRAGVAPTRDALIATIVADARPGDLVLVMGARDPSLHTLAREIARATRGAAVTE